MDMPVGDNKPESTKNVLGEPMVICCEDPLTGFYRTGKCDTGPDDHGLHTVCVQATSEFLEYSKSVGNDLSTPMTEFGFPGLKEGTVGGFAYRAGSRHMMLVKRRGYIWPPLMKLLLN